MATADPAQLIGQQGHVGALTKGARADLLHLSDDLTLCRIWQADVQIK
jgi:N-acetylglucosamine-6-phosphate deacetylase